MITNIVVLDVSDIYVYAQLKQDLQLICMILQVYTLFSVSYLGLIYGLYRDNGKENGNSYNGYISGLHSFVSPLHASTIVSFSI